MRSYHTQTLKALAEFVAAAGLSHPREFALEHFSRRISSHEVLDLAQSYPPLEPGALLAGVRGPPLQGRLDDREPGILPAKRLRPRACDEDGAAVSGGIAERPKRGHRSVRGLPNGDAGGSWMASAISAASFNDIASMQPRAPLRQLCGQSRY